MKRELIDMTWAWDKEKIRIPDVFYHTYYTHDNFDSADPSSMQDACQIWTQLNDLALVEFS